MTEKSFGECYPSLSQLGLSSMVLLAVADDSDDGAIEALHIPVSKVTNRTMLELHNFSNRNPSCTYYTYWKWASMLLRNSRTEFPTIKSMRQNIVRLSLQLAKLKKMPSSEEKLIKLTEFYDQEYELPNVFMARGRLVVSPRSSSSDESSATCSSCAEWKDLVKKSRQKAHDVHRNSQKKA